MAEDKSGNIEVQEFIPGKANESSIKCIKCSCLLLRKDHGTYVCFEVKLPSTTAKTEADGSTSAVDMEVVKELIEVADIFTFENMGFSHSVDGKKYLVCADCEWGPIGYQDLTTSKSYLSLDRINTVTDG